MIQTSSLSYTDIEEGYSIYQVHAVRAGEYANFSLSSCNLFSPKFVDKLALSYTKE